MQMRHDEVGRDAGHRMRVVIEPVAVRIVRADHVNPGGAAQLQHSAHEAASAADSAVPDGGRAGRLCSAGRRDSISTAAIVGGGGLGRSPGPVVGGGADLHLLRAEELISGSTDSGSGNSAANDRHREGIGPVGPHHGGRPEDPVGQIVDARIVQPGAPHPEGTVARGDVDEARADAVEGGVGGAVGQEGADGEVAEVGGAVRELARIPEAALAPLDVVGAQLRLVLVAVRRRKAIGIVVGVVGIVIVVVVVVIGPVDVDVLGTGAVIVDATAAAAAATNVGGVPLPTAGSGGTAAEA